MNFFMIFVICVAKKFGIANNENLVLAEVENFHDVNYHNLMVRLFCWWTMSQARTMRRR